jgi:hypothetical protein
VPDDSTTSARWLNNLLYFFRLCSRLV